MVTRSGPAGYAAQWNDDIHHAWHVGLTGESHGYYGDYADNPERDLGRALAQGYVYQGETSSFSGTPRGEPSDHLAPTNFIAFLQNHDQIGNRAFGERLTTLTRWERLAAAAATHLLCPQIPLLFMGEEWATQTPFQFFCGFDGDLAQAVRDGRRREFGLTDIPDPIENETVARSRLKWQELDDPWAAERLRYYRTLLTLRAEHLAPLLPDLKPGRTAGGGEQALLVMWPTQVPDGRQPGRTTAKTAAERDRRATIWGMAVNLSDIPRPAPTESGSEGQAPHLIVAVISGRVDDSIQAIPSRLPPWSAYVFKEAPT